MFTQIMYKSYMGVYNMKYTCTINNNMANFKQFHTKCSFLSALNFDIFLLKL